MHIQPIAHARSTDDVFFDLTQCPEFGGPGDAAKPGLACAVFTVAATAGALAGCAALNTLTAWLIG